MKRIILKWLGLDKVVATIELNKILADMDWSGLSSTLVRHRSELDNHTRKLGDLAHSLDNRRDEHDWIIETLQNLDNNEVIRNLHNRIKKLEEQS